MKKVLNKRLSLLIMRTFIILGVIFITTSSLLSKETFNYKIIIREQEVGKMIYEVEEENGAWQIQSFIEVEGKREQDAQITISPDTYEPLHSQKWVRIPGGEIVIETTYQEGKAQIKITSPEGTKEATISIPSPTFDSEEIPYLIGKLSYEEKAISVLVPISGMVWRGEIQKIAESEEEETFRFTLGGEITYLRYQKETPRLVELRAPQRGYNLVLEDTSRRE
ncbi:MAG TPA: hypothetical protein PK016_01205 [Candidatus Atribacteria bacterium]|nr:hypothetical protein [Candidatus Atribacteria bacterium]